MPLFTKRKTKLHSGRFPAGSVNLGRLFSHKNGLICTAAVNLTLGFCLLALFFANGVRAEESYPYYMAQCAKAKSSADMVGVEDSILRALQYGPGDEYAWRTLAWAQGKQGKWPESLTNACENVRRNGVSGWSLAQLAESALGYGDFALARKTLKLSDTLPQGSLHGSEAELRRAYDRLRAVTAERTYDLRFEIRLKRAGRQERRAWLLMPQLSTDRQTFTFQVTNVVSFQTRHVGTRDYIEVVQKPGESFYIDGRLTLKPFCLGARLNHVPGGECAEELKPYLTKFQNRSWWDPEQPEVREIANTVKGPTDAQTVQNVLNWFRNNIRYDATIEDDPALGQLGTILKLRYGGCHHNSGLFVTLCRAAGVPACVMHGYHLPLDDKAFDSLHSVGHAWAEVYINSLGWVPVEPMDPESLRFFTAKHTYMTVGVSNRPPEEDYFRNTIEYEGQEYRAFTIQFSEEISGRLVEVKQVE